MPRYDSTRLASYFDAEVSRAPDMRAYNQENLWIPRGQTPAQKPDNKRFHRRGDDWVPEDWGYLTKEQLEARKKKAQEQRQKRQGQKPGGFKKKRSPEQIAAYRAKCKTVKDEHDAAMRIVMETGAFGHAQVLEVLKYVNARLETLRTRQREKMDELKKEFPYNSPGIENKEQRRATQTALGKERVSPFKNLATHMKTFEEFCHEDPEFIDFFNTGEVPTITFMSTAISFLSMAKHQIMKALEHKVSQSADRDSTNAKKFLAHTHKAKHLLGKMKRGWHTGMVKSYREDAAEHNEFQRHIMTEKYNEWVHYHKGEPVPKYVRYFDPSRPRRPRKTNPGAMPRHVEGG